MTRLREVRLASENHPQAKEPPPSVWGEASAYALALSLKRHAYLCPGTAVFLHALTGQLLKTIYVGAEQSETPRGQRTFTEWHQPRLRRQTEAVPFRHPIRRVQYWTRERQATQRLEAGAMVLEGKGLHVTGLKRTRVDITWHPAYA